MKIWHYILAIGFIFIAFGHYSSNAYFYHSGIILTFTISYSTWMNYTKRNEFRNLGYGFLFLLLWYLSFEYAAWLSSESWWSDAIIRGLGLLPTLIVLKIALGISVNKGRE